MLKCRGKNKDLPSCNDCIHKKVCLSWAHTIANNIVDMVGEHYLCDEFEAIIDSSFFEGLFNGDDSSIENPKGIAGSLSKVYDYDVVYYGENGCDGPHTTHFYAYSLDEAIKQANEVLKNRYGDRYAIISCAKKDTKRKDELS